MGRLLDNYDRLQAQPFGTFTASKSDPGLRNMNSQRSAMTSALRRGIREAKRKGDFERVEKGVAMGNAYGLQTTGIGSYDNRMAGGEAFADRVTKEADINEKLANRAAAGVDKIGNMPQVEIPEDTVNPNATAGAGNGTPIKKSAGEAFVSRVTSEAAPALDPVAEAEGVVDDVLDDKTDLASATRKAVSMGGNAYSLADAIKRRASQRARRATGTV